MIRLIATLVVAAMSLSSVALAAESKDSNFSQYSLSASFSPFGGSFNVGYNANVKTTWQFSIGGFAGEAPFKPEIEGTEYTIDGSTNWVGVFLNHRPIQGSEWFRFVAGIGFGNIQNEVDDGNGNVYGVDYTENPVGYLGIGFGAEVKKGFIWGFDIGLLHTGGPTVYSISGDSAALEDIKDSALFGSVLPNAQLTLGWGF